jgi:hypothetical protein
MTQHEKTALPRNHLRDFRLTGSSEVSVEHPDLDMPGGSRQCSRWSPAEEGFPVVIRPLTEGGYELALYLRTLPKLGRALREASGKPGYALSRLVAAAEVEMLSDYLP